MSIATIKVKSFLIGLVLRLNFNRNFEHCSQLRFLLLLYYLVFKVFREQGKILPNVEK